MILRSKISKSHLGTHAFRLKLLQRHKTKAFLNFRATIKNVFFSDSAARLSVLKTYSVSNVPFRVTAADLKKKATDLGVAQIFE